MRRLEPLAKLMSGDWLPRFGPFPGWNFAPWNHHAAHSIPKIDSKWDCHSSTQSFARGNLVILFLKAQTTLSQSDVTFMYFSSYFLSFSPKETGLFSIFDHSCTSNPDHLKAISLRLPVRARTQTGTLKTQRLQTGHSHLRRRMAHHIPALKSASCNRARYTSHHHRWKFSGSGLEC